MRYFYTDDSGRTADICLYTDGKTARLVIRSVPGSRPFRKEYHGTAAAKNALAAYGGDWTNDITGRHLDADLTETD